MLRELRNRQRGSPQMIRQSGNRQYLSVFRQFGSCRLKISSKEILRGYRAEPNAIRYDLQTLLEQNLIETNRQRSAYELLPR